MPSSAPGTRGAGSSIRAIDAVVQDPKGANGSGAGLLSWPLVGRGHDLEQVVSLLADRDIAAVLITAAT